jgi:hypothetical protein
MKQTNIHFNSHPFPYKNYTSVSVLILTILLSACGGSSSENSTTTKETEIKVVPKKEAKVETKKPEPKEEAIPEPVIVKEEVIEEPPLVLPPPPKLPYSKEDMLTALTAIKIPDSNSVADTSAKDKEEFQTKMKEKVEKEVKKVIDDYFKLGTETLPTEITKIKKTIKDTFDEFLKDKDDKWESKPTDNSSPECKKYLQSECADLLKWLEKKSYLEQGVDSLSTLTKNRCSLVGLKASTIEECANHQIKKDKIEGIIDASKPYVKSYDAILSDFLNPDKKLNIVDSDLSSYFKVFYSCEGTEETALKLIKEHNVFVFNYQKNKIIIEANKKLLQELSLIKKKMESDVESNTLDKSKYIEGLTILLDKEKIFISSTDTSSEAITNILKSKDMRYSQKPETGRFEKEVVEGFREKVDSEIPKKLIAVFEMDEQNKLTLENARLEIIRLKAEREARIELAKEKARQKILKAEEDRKRAMAEKEEKIFKAQAEANAVILKAKAEKIRKSNKYSDLDSYELALMAYPPTLDVNSFARTSDLSTLKGKIFDLNTGVCLQSLGSGKALMKIEFFETPILVEALNPAYENTVYVNKFRYQMLIKFTGTTSYKNLLGGDAQAVKAQVIYVNK